MNVLGFIAFLQIHNSPNVAGAIGYGLEMGIQVSVEVFLGGGLNGFRGKVEASREHQKGLGHINAACFYKQAEGEARGYLNLTQPKRAAPGRRALGCNEGGLFLFCGGQECFCRKQCVFFVELYCEGKAFVGAGFIQNGAHFTRSRLAWENSRQGEVADIHFRKNSGADNEAEQEAQHEIEQVVTRIEGGDSHTQ